jgi:glycosyltransferase involved in cell wall biosynthesis
LGYKSRIKEAHVELTVVMPVFEERETVERAIASVLATEFPHPCELIVVDDGSRDGTGELLRGGTFPAHVRLLAHDRNLGKGAAIRIGNRTVTLAANVLYNAWISDLMTGQKALGTELFRSLDLRERGFAVEAEIAARLLSRGVRIYEVPVEYRARSREEGKKLTALDGLRVLRTLLRCRIW